MHGMLDENQEHKTWRKVDGQWRCYNYAEPFSRYSRGKHWIDDHNNCRYNPTGLEEVWGTKWWPMCQFTFICGVSEVNACYSWARGWHEVPVLQLKFWCKLVSSCFATSWMSLQQSLGGLVEMGLRQICV